jgi:hypothetical protein
MMGIRGGSSPSTSALDPSDMHAPAHLAKISALRRDARIPLAVFYLFAEECANAPQAPVLELDYDFAASIDLREVSASIGPGPHLCWCLKIVVVRVANPQRRSAPGTRYSRGRGIRLPYS